MRTFLQLADERLERRPLVKREKTSLWGPVLCFVAAVLWTLNLIIYLAYSSISIWGVALRGLNVLVWLLVSILLFRRYKKSKAHAVK